jgi:cytochrome c oxidase subunit 4
MTGHLRSYVLAFGALLALTALTVLAARFDLGEGNTVAGLSIAAAKASIVAWYFMQLRSGPALVRLFALSGVFWFLLMVSLTFADYASRTGVLSGQ